MDTLIVALASLAVGFIIGALVFRNNETKANAVIAQGQQVASNVSEAATTVASDVKTAETDVKTVVSDVKAATDNKA